MIKRILIIGAGELGKSISWYATNNGFDVVGYVDDYATSSVNGIPILGKLIDIPSLYEKGLFDALICGIGYNHLDARQTVFEQYSIKMRIPYATIIDKSCHVDPSATINEGCILFPGCLVDKGVILEKNVLLNIGVTIAHDSIIKSHSFICPRVAMAGFSSIGERCMIGINTTIVDNVLICSDIRTGGGTTIIKNLDKKGLYVGTPAKWIKD